jgi:hypothetical protein
MNINCNCRKMLLQKLLLQKMLLQKLVLQKLLLQKIVLQKLVIAENVIAKTVIAKTCIAENGLCHDHYVQKLLLHIYMNLSGNLYNIFFWLKESISFINKQSIRVQTPREYHSSTITISTIHSTITIH